jgi:hypothetical protein
MGWGLLAVREANMDEDIFQRVADLELRLTATQRKLARRDRAQSWWAVAAGLVALGLPALAWTYAKPHPDFEPGTPISSAHEGGFDSQGGTVMLFVSGSAYRSTMGGLVGIDVIVDGTSVGSVRAFTNEIASHKVFVSTPFVVDLTAGAHTIQLQPLPDTASDFNDPFVVVALELPR